MLMAGRSSVLALPARGCTKSLELFPAADTPEACGMCVCRHWLPLESLGTVLCPSIPGTLKMDPQGLRSGHPGSHTQPLAAGSQPFPQAAPGPGAGSCATSKTSPPSPFKGLFPLHLGASQSHSSIPFHWGTHSVISPIAQDF